MVPIAKIGGLRLEVDSEEAEEEDEAEEEAEYDEQDRYVDEEPDAVQRDRDVEPNAISAIHSMLASGALLESIGPGVEAQQDE